MLRRFIQITTKLVGAIGGTVGLIYGWGGILKVLALVGHIANVDSVLAFASKMTDPRGNWFTRLMDRVVSAPWQAYLLCWVAVIVVLLACWWLLHRQETQSDTSQSTKETKMEPKDTSKLPPFPSAVVEIGVPQNQNSGPSATIHIGGGENIQMDDSAVYGGHGSALKITGGQHLRFNRNKFIGGFPPDEENHG
jgi:hypothetical protein